MNALLIKLQSLSTIDQILLIILCISLLLKIIKEIVSYALTWFLEHKKGSGACKSLKIDQKDVKCSHPLYAEKNFQQHGNICSHKDCPGYRSKDIETNDIFKSHWLLSIIIVVVDWGIQLPSVILIIRTLLEVTNK